MKSPIMLVAFALILAICAWQASSFFDASDRSGPALGAPGHDGREADDQGRAQLAAPDLESVGAGIDRAQVTPAAAPVEPSSTAAATTGTLVLCTTRADGTPVPGVTSFVSPRQAARLGHETAEYRTDDQGLARAEKLRPGTYSIVCLAGPQKRAEVVAGEETEVLLEFTGVVDVQGVVRDPEGRPVAGADVWLVLWRNDWLGTQHITRTAADGTFLAQHVDAEKSLGATADGFAPSLLVDLERTDSESSPVAIELVLTPGGGALRGSVLDPSGRPLAGARVAVGRSPTEYSMRDDGTAEEFWCARVATTDAAGAFAFTGLEAGTLPLHALAGDYPEYAAEVEILANSTATHDVRLSPAMSVRGIVKDASGAPVAQALVLALDAPFVDPFPTQGPTEKGSPFHRPATRSDDAGAFHLTCLTPGAVHLYSAKGTSFWDRGEFFGTVQETLSGAAGETLEWNPVLSRGHEIRGRVLYADGAPLTNVFVSASDDEGKRFTEHTRDGRFAIPGLEQRAYKVHVQLLDAPDDARPLEQEGVWPSESELVLTASYSKRVEEKGLARARIDDRAERVQGKGGIVFAHAGGWYYSGEKDGVYSASLPPDRYQARVMSGDTLVGTSEWFDLGPGEERDLGAIPTRAAGSLVVRVRRPPEEPERAVFVTVDTVDVGRGARRMLGAGTSEVAFEDLLAGPATVTVDGLRVARETRTVEVGAGGPTTVEVDLEPAAQVSVEVSAAHTEGFGTVTLRLLGPDGRVFGDLSFHERHGAVLPLKASFFAPPGRFTLEASTSMGLAARAELVVESVTADPTASLALE